jgi:hypothetical protein
LGIEELKVKGEVTSDISTDGFGNGSYGKSSMASPSLRKQGGSFECLNKENASSDVSSNLLTVKSQEFGKTKARESEPQYKPGESLGESRRLKTKSSL